MCQENESRLPFRSLAVVVGLGFALGVTPQFALADEVSPS